MKKVVGVLIAITLFAVPLNAVAAVKAGATCKKAGITSTYGGKKYTCVKSGKKLVWNKGVAVVKPTPTPTVTPTPTPTPTVTPTPTPTVTPTPTPTVPPIVIPKTFDELYGNSQGIALAAWTSTNDKIKKSDAVAVRQDIFVGPNTTIPNANVKGIFENATRIFAGFAQPQSFYAVYYRFQDKDWAKAKFAELNISYLAGQIDGSCGSL